jgi:hypothetical protein
MLPNKKRKLFFLSALSILGSLITTSTWSQEVTDTARAHKSSYIKFSVNYLSNALYYGRKDTFALPYITPSILYRAKSGVYVEGSLSYLSKTGEGQINAGALTLGYEFDSRNQKVSGDVYASKYFTSSTSTAVNSTVKAALGGVVSYDFDVIQLSGGTDVFFSNKPDIVLTMEASHEFLFGNSYNWSVEPLARINAGTENFYEDYFTKRKYSVRRRRGMINTQPNVLVIKNNFSVLDYEVSMPLSYDTKKWGFSITPSYAIPVNPVKYSFNNGATYKTEQLSNTFYMEVGAYLKFSLKS